MKQFRVLLTREANAGERPGHISPSIVMFARTRRIDFLKDFTPDDVADFGQQWIDVGLSKLKKSERLKAFFRFAHESGWIPTNPARSLRPPKPANPGVVAFTAEELARIMDACTDERLKTFILVMRFSGLAIGDAVQLRPDRLDGEHLTLRPGPRRTKPCVLLLPTTICNRLRSLSALEGGYYF